MMATTDLAVCLRDLDHPVARVSFPSKLIDCMAMGVPVLATLVLPHDTLDGRAVIADDTSVDAIARAITVAMALPDLQALAASAHAFVTAEFDWDVVASKLLDDLPIEGGAHPQLI